jgi:hypothetical protein
MKTDVADRSIANQLFADSIVVRSKLYYKGAEVSTGGGGGGGIPFPIVYESASSIITEANTDAYTYSATDIVGEFVNRIVKRNGDGFATPGCTDTLPSALLLYNAMLALDSSIQLGSSIRFTIKNRSTHVPAGQDFTRVIKLALGADMVYSVGQTNTPGEDEATGNLIPPGYVREILLRLSSIVSPYKFTVYNTAIVLGYN